MPSLQRFGVAPNRFRRPRASMLGFVVPRSDTCHKILNLHKRIRLRPDTANELGRGSAETTRFWFCCVGRRFDDFALHGWRQLLHYSSVVHAHEKDAAL